MMQCLTMAIDKVFAPYKGMYVLKAGLLRYVKIYVYVLKSCGMTDSAITRNL